MATSPSSLSDLVSRARTGDDHALDELLATLEPIVQRFGRRLCRHDDDADDVRQDTLLALSRHLADFESRASFTSWVFALARSACARRRRGLANRPHASTEDVPDAVDATPSAEDRIALREDTEALGEAIAALPAAHREVLFLRDLEGLSAAEAASVLGISVDALKSRLHRAREALRAVLVEYDRAPRDGAVVASDVRRATRVP